MEKSMENEIQTGSYEFTAACRITCFIGGCCWGVERVYYWGGINRDQFRLYVRLFCRVGQGCRLSSI